MSVEVKIRNKGEPVDKALRRFKKKLDRESIIRDARFNRYFKKPSAIKRQKTKEQAFSDMLRRRREDS